MAPLAALLLADGRFPGGGHAHSGGLEAAVNQGTVHDLVSLESFLVGRLVTGGAVDAWLAATANLSPAGDPDATRGRSGVGAPGEAMLDAEADARCPSPALRAASRQRGRGLRRAASRSFPVLVGGVAEHHSVVVGVVCAAAGLGPDDAARLVVHAILAGTASAAVRLLPMDMADTMSVAMGLTSLADDIANTGARLASGRGRLDDGPAWTGPMVELAAEDHARWEVRLFAS